MRVRARTRRDGRLPVPPDRWVAVTVGVGEEGWGRRDVTYACDKVHRKRRQCVRVLGQREKGM